MAWLFVLCVVLSVLLAFILRAKCSGPRLGYGLFCLCLIYNLFFITGYMRVLEFDRILFFGYQAEFIKKNIMVGWAALVGVLLHCGAMPFRTRA
ncbi:hypothetical protein [Pseudomonas putida]|uniref:hypothetical protein n=1 Tax=Pseudomonas putida TaxID=303 RepID=UPI0024E06165|nr:hypothetical protein [Pseudomonas putida]HDS0978940.1 hypothetical protein [Pseudomonas putida]